MSARVHWLPRSNGSVFPDNMPWTARCSSKGLVRIFVRLGNTEGNFMSQLNASAQ